MNRDAGGRIAWAESENRSIHGIAQAMRLGDTCRRFAMTKGLMRRTQGNDRAQWIRPGRISMSSDRGACIKKQEKGSGHTLGRHHDDLLEPRMLFFFSSVQFFSAEARKMRPHLPTSTPW